MLASRPLRTLAVLTISAAALTACGSSSSDTAANDGTITIVASTNVYGDIAKQIAGDRAEVTSIIASSSQDPHEYEASAQDRLKVGDADIVIENGGGYDPFVDTLLDDARSKATVINAVDLSGLAPTDEKGDKDEKDHADGDHEGEGHSEEGHDHVEGFNEHVWYDFDAVEKVAKEIADQLGEIDADNAEAYQGDYTAFVAKVDALKAEAAKLRAATDGKGVAITEPVPLYLLEALGLQNRTPEAFSEAVEEGADVPARVLQQTLDLVEGGQVVMLAYNDQAADSTTEQVRKAAEGAGVPVVDFTETLPEGSSYVEWQQKNLDDVAAALR